MRARQEYALGCNDLNECLRQHVSFCLYNDFDQILQSDKITVKCCNCGHAMHVAFNEIATCIFCDDCKHEPITAEHIEKLNERLRQIKNMLLFNANHQNDP